MVGAALKLLDGWKLVIGVALLFLASVWDQMRGDGTGQTSGVIRAVLSVFGWMPTGLDLDQAVASTVVLVGFVHKIWKSHEQSRAGATVGELLSTVGHVKEAIAEGTIPSVPIKGEPKVESMPPLAR